MAKETREQKAARARAERRIAAILDFQKRVVKALDRRIYTDAMAFAAADAGDNSGMSIYEMLSDYRRTRDQFAKNVERMQQRMTDAKARLDEGNAKASWYSTLLGDLPADLEREASKMETLADAIVRLAWATNWWVGEVLTEQGRAAFHRLRGIEVFSVSGGAIGSWKLLIDGNAFAVDGNVVFYSTPEDAWVAAMTVCGERIDY